VRPGQAPADTSEAATASADNHTPERELMVGSGALALPATLTLPQSAPVAGVVLVHGSGAHDRDETIGPNRPFRDLAIGLAERGVAVLRYEKRSRAHPESFSGVSFTVREEVVDDALLALAALKAAPELEGKPIFLAGHSLGAMLAPRIALEARDLRGMVLMAAPARGLADLIPEQIQYLNALDGVTSDEERAKFAEIQTVLARVSKLSDADRNDPTPILGAPAAYWLDLANYQPIRQAERLKLPTLLLQGERDYQVTPAIDYRAWTEALGTADWFQSRQFPGLSHLFMPAADPASPADYQVPAHVSADVLDAMASWIKQQATGS
jgi:hypothetical protein